MAPGASVTFSISQTLPVENAADTYTNTVSVSAKDDDTGSTTATDSASVTVTYTNVNPTIKVTKSADVSTISEGGVGNQTVVYTYTVKNTSPASTDPVTVTSL